VQRLAELLRCLRRVAVHDRRTAQARTLRRAPSRGEGGGT
jgi:hypothetical protein